MFSSEKLIDVAPSQRDVGFLFQNYALWPHMTVFQNIAFGLENLKWPKDKIDARVKELLKLLKIEEFPNRYPAELSGGQQQRVAIARTLATNPRILLMDEPLSNLDAKLRMEMRAELKRLHHETGATFVYVTHDQLEAMTLATKICLLDKGVLQQYAPPLMVYAHPANTFVADFVGSPSINLVDGMIKTVQGGTVTLDVDGFTATMEMGDGFKGVDIVPAKIGIRPEYISLSEEGVPARVISSLPSGMETIVHLEVRKGLPLTSVIFGQNDFAVGSTLHVTFPTDRCMLFDDKGNLVGLGKLTLR